MMLGNLVKQMPGTLPLVALFHRHWWWRCRTPHLLEDGLVQSSQVFLADCRRHISLSPLNKLSVNWGSSIPNRNMSHMSSWTRIPHRWRLACCKGNSRPAAIHLGWDGSYKTVWRVEDFLGVTIGCVGYWDVGIHMDTYGYIIIIIL